MVDPAPGIYVDDRKWHFDMVDMATKNCTELNHIDMDMNVKLMKWMWLITFMCWVFFDMMALVSMLFLGLLGSIHQRSAASYEQKINIPCSYMGDKKNTSSFCHQNIMRSFPMKLTVTPVLKTWGPHLLSSLCHLRSKEAVYQRHVHLRPFNKAGKRWADQN